MLEFVTSGLGQVIEWIKVVLDSLLGTAASGSPAYVGALSALSPLMIIGISISVIFLTVKIVKSLVWGM